MRDPFINPIHSDGVLDQVICADAEKVDFTSQGICNQGRTRHFDHDSKFNIFCKSCALFAEFGLAGFQYLLCLSQLGQAGDHREHDANITKSAGTQNSSQLRLENVRAIETEPDRATA